jgi:hypothetical protein
MQQRSLSLEKVLFINIANHYNRYIARVGKTSLTYRFAHGAFNEKQPSTVDATCIEKEAINRHKQE